MMRKNIGKIMKEELERIKPSEDDEKKIGAIVREFVLKLNSKLKKYKAEAVMGGSFVKGTTIKKKRYDVDLFVLFKEDEKMLGNSKNFQRAKNQRFLSISDKLEKALKELKVKYSRLPGSRDYFSIDSEVSGIKFKTEIVPVFRIKKSEEARNVTDVSMLHVNYVKNKIRKNPKLPDEIRLAKALCYAQNCYGAESHIKGFSGYCLEILTCYYGSFLNLMKNASKWNQKKIIDPGKHYKNENEIMTEVNEAKLMSPLVLIDPVQMNRNAAAALDNEKYNLFIESAKKFLKNPSGKLFEKKEFDPKRFIETAKKKKLSLFEVYARSERVKEDISGAKLLKLHNVLIGTLKKEEYEIMQEWDFSDQKSVSYFALKSPKVILQKGPPVARAKHAKEFKNRWKKVFVKNGDLYTKREPKDALAVLNLNKKLLRDMGIDSFRVKKIF